MTMTRQTQLWALTAAAAGTTVVAVLFLRRRSGDEAAWKSRMEERIRELSDQDAERRRQLSELSQSAADLRRDMRGIVEREEPIRQQIKALQAAESSIRSDLEDLSASWVQADDRAKRSEEQRQELERRIDDLAALGTRLDGQVADLSEREFAQRSEEEALEEQLKRANADKVKLEQRVSTLEDEAQRLTTERDRAVEKSERLSKEAETLQEQLDRAQAKVQSAEAERLIAQQNLEAQSNEFLTHFSGKINAESDGSTKAPDTVETFAALVEAAREHLNHIELPASAERDLDALDAALEAEFWAQDAWLGLRALDEYARDVGDFTGGFWEWCKNSNAQHRWPASQKKLAMKESDSVTHSRDLSRKREFEVSTELQNSGRLVMHAHLKVAEGGGQNIPRIYFYDDAKGDTGKVHIGFIGPHRLVPNTKTS